MAQVEQKHRSSKSCMLCGKGDTIRLNRPHSLKRTKAVVKPNLQKKFGAIMCRTCFRTLGKKGL